MREALGVRTSRSFSVIETGEALQRNDEPSPTRSDVLVRLSHGHIRYGSFQRFAYLGESENIARLADYSLQHLLNDRHGGDDAAPRLRAEEETSELQSIMGNAYAGFCLTKKKHRY